MVATTEDNKCPDDITPEGKHFIKQWLITKHCVEDAKHGVTRAECNFANAETALAKWLAPSDIKPGEKIGVWYGDSLFQVESVESLSYPAPIANNSEEDTNPIRSHKLKVTVRTRGKHFRELTW